MPLRGVQTIAFNSGTSHSIDLPITTAVGDVATLLVATNNTTVALDRAGWTWHGITAPNASNTSIAVWTKTIQTSDITPPNNTLTVTTGTANRWTMVAMVRYDVTGLDAAPVLTSTTITSTAVAAPSIGVVTPGAELVSIYGCRVYASGIQVAYNLPSGQTLAANICGTSGSFNNSTICVGEEVVLAAGVTGTRTATSYNIVTPGVGEERVMTGAVTIAFTPLVPYSPPAPDATVKVRQSGAWVEKPLKARVGGVWA